MSVHIIFKVAFSRVQKKVHILRQLSSKILDKIQIPPPTWSINDLHLSSAPSDTSISDEEYHKLAYRCLIDIRVFTPEENRRMKQSLCDIMRCVSVVTDHVQASNGSDPLSSMNQDHTHSVKSKADVDTSELKPLDENDLVKKNSCDTTRSRIEEQNDWIVHDRKEAEEVLQYIRQGKGDKMMRREEDGHWYFSLRTDADSSR
jgi:hypothetical protein